MKTFYNRYFFRNYTVLLFLSISRLFASEHDAMFSGTDFKNAVSAIVTASDAETAEFIALKLQERFRPHEAFQRGATSSDSRAQILQRSLAVQERVSAAETDLIRMTFFHPRAQVRSIGAQFLVYAEATESLRSLLLGVVNDAKSSESINAYHIAFEKRLWTPEFGRYLEAYVSRQSDRGRVDVLSRTAKLGQKVLEPHIFLLLKMEPSIEDRKRWTRPTYYGLTLRSYLAAAEAMEFIDTPGQDLITSAGTRVVMLSDIKDSSACVYVAERLQHGVNVALGKAQREPWMARDGTGEVTGLTQFGPGWLRKLINSPGSNKKSEQEPSKSDGQH
jgi:hypothetical protein